MTIHKEGTATIVLTGLFSFAIAYLGYVNIPSNLSWLSWLVIVLMSGFWLFIISFFRVPARQHTFNENAVISPADGKVVVIEETTDPEYFKDKRLQISVFMSPANVHQNRYPISGKVIYSQYHKGKYLVAWDPKSSTENERHSVVIANAKTTLLVKQIAGALARRIVNYAQVGTEIGQNDEMGFIKFGSRVDVLLPPGAKPAVKIGDKVKNGISVLATL